MIGCKEIAISAFCTLGVILTTPGACTTCTATYLRCRIVNRSRGLRITRRFTGLAHSGACRTKSRFSISACPGLISSRFTVGGLG